MKYILMLAALIIFMVFVPFTPHVVADWQGTIKADSAELRLILYIARK